MREIRIRFFGDLEDLVLPHLRGRTALASFNGRRSIKDLVESYRIPNTEIAFLRVHGKFVDFSRILEDGDDVSVYPLSFRQEFKQARPLTMAKPEIIAFVCDVHLWKLARYLRFLGFDTAFDKTLDDPELALQSHDEKRILLTRDRKLLMRNLVWRGQLIRSMKSEEQVSEVIQRFEIQSDIRPFTRCALCNQSLVPVQKNDLKYREIEDRIPAGIKSRHDHYSTCPGCAAIYWQGTHFKRLQTTFKNILK